MNLRPQRREDPDVNLTPLIDVVFLLLIFFMITTTFMRESDIEISLPEANGAPTERDAEIFEIVIDSQGRYFVSDREVVNRNTDGIKAALAKAREKFPNQPLIIRADGQAPHQSVVTVMDAAGQINISNIAFATSISSGEE